MEFLVVSHNTALVIASIVIAIAAGFTGLTLSKDLSKQSVSRRKGSVAVSAIALGGGIWSMHFVAMLGIQMPILFYYDAAITLASALLAILIVGTALLLLHFRERTPATLSAAGALVGCGILAMHFVGMAGLQLCRAVYTPFGIVLAVVSAIGLCIGAFWIAYGRRTNRSILLGTLCFGAAVSTVHFVAIAGTRFLCNGVYITTCCAACGLALSLVAGRQRAIFAAGARVFMRCLSNFLLLQKLKWYHVAQCTQVLFHCAPQKRVFFFLQSRANTVPQAHQGHDFTAWHGVFPLVFVR